MPGISHDHPIETPVRRTLLKIGNPTAGWHDVKTLAIW